MEFSCLTINKYLINGDMQSIFFRFCCCCVFRILIRNSNRLSIEQLRTKRNIHCCMTITARWENQQLTMVTYDKKTHTRRSSQFSIGSSVIIELFNIEWLDFKFYFNSWKIIASVFFPLYFVCCHMVHPCKSYGKKN